MMHVMMDTDADQLCKDLCQNNENLITQVLRGHTDEINKVMFDLESNWVLSCRCVYLLLMNTNSTFVQMSYASYYLSFVRDYVCSFITLYIDFTLMSIFVAVTTTLFGCGEWFRSCPTLLPRSSSIK